MKIKVLMITYNRPHYTRLSLERLLKTLPPNAKAVIWDNASDKDTKDVIKAFERHPRLEKVIYNSKNEKLWGPTNWFWENAGDADLLSKVDDDCLMPHGWCEALTRAHSDITEAGILGCWRFPPEDFDANCANRKIREYNSHSILRNCWVEGSGYLMKRGVLKKNGVLKPGESFTTYCLRAASRGFINGWYYPFLYQEHMDDPRAEHSGIKTDEDLRRLLPLSAAQFGISTKDAWTERLRTSAKTLQTCSIDPYDYIGLKAKLKRKIFQLLGKQYLPRA